MLRKSKRVQKRSRVIRVIAPVVAGCLAGLSPFGMQSAMAAPATWTGLGGDNLLSNPANWSTNAVPSSAGDVATWDGLQAGALSLTTNVLWTVNSGNGGGTSFVVTSNQTSALTIGGAAGVNFGIDNFTVASGAGAVLINPAGQLVFRGGDAIVQNDSANTLTFGAGIGAWNNGGGVGRIVTFQGSTTTQVLGNFVLGGAGDFQFVKTGTGTATFSGAQNGSNSGQGSTFGSMTISNGTLQFSGAAQLGTQGSFGTYNTNITNNATLNWNSSANQTLGGVMSGSGKLIQSGSGVLTLSGNNTFGGGTTLSAGTIALGNNGALGTSGNIVFNGGALRYTSGITTDYSARIASGTSTSAVAIDTNGQNVNFANGLTSSQSGGLTKLGAGILTLNGSNAHTGATTIGAGTLRLGSGTNITSSAVTVGASGKLATGFSANAQSATVGSSVSQTNGGSIDFRDGFSGTLNVGNGLTLSGGTMGFDIGAASDTLALTGGSYAASNSNVITLADLGSVNTGSAYNLITGATGISTSNFTIANPTFIIGFAASLQTAGGALQLVFAPSTSSPTAFLNVNGASNFTPASFSLNANGTGSVTSIDGGTAITFSSDLVTGAGAKTVTVTALQQDVKSLTVADTSAVTITGNNILSVVDPGGITVNGGAGSLTISTTTLSLGVSQTWTNNSVNDARVSAVVSGTGKGLTIGGTGKFVLTGANTYDGLTTINSGATLQLGDGTTGNDGTIATTSGVTNNGTLAFNRFGSSTAAVLIGGSGNVVKAGAGTQTLSNAANSYTGATIINGGTLSVATLAAGGANSNIGASGNAAANLVINGGTLQYTGGGATTDRNITIGDGNATIDGSGTGQLNFNGNGASVVAFSTPDVPRTLTLTGTFAGATDGSGNNNNVLGGIITNNGQGTLSVVKNGTTYWRMSGANTFSGDMVINSGGVEYDTFAFPTALGTGTLRINGGILGARGNDSTLTNPFVVIGGDFTIGLTDAATGVRTTLNGNIDLGTAVRTITVRDYVTNADYSRPDATFAGVISNTGGITKAGSGTLRLSGANTYSGNTTLNAGTLLLTNSTPNTNTNTLALQNSTLVMSAGTVSFGEGTLTTLSSATFGGLSGTANIALQNLNSTPGAVALTVGGNNASTTYTGILSGSGSLTKVGTGSLTLSGSNTYSGTTTLTGGKLRLSNVGGSSATGTGNVALSGGTSATISGTGSASGAVTATTGTRIAPALNTTDADLSGRNNFGVVGTLTLGSSGGLTLTSANLDFDLATTAAAASDKVVSASVALDAGSSPVVFNFAGTTLDTTAAYTLVDASGATAVSGNLANVSANFLGGLSGQYSAVFATGSGGVVSGGGNEDLLVTFSAVPEPTSLGLLGLAGMSLLRRRRAELSPSRCE